MTDRNPFDPAYYGDKNDTPANWPKGNLIWDHLNEQLVGPVDFQMQRCRDALSSLAVIRGFDLPDLIVIADIARKNDDYATTLVGTVERETGIRFRITAYQWGVILHELNDLLSRRVS